MIVSSSMPKSSRTGFTTTIIRRWDELNLRDPDSEAIIGSFINRPFNPTDPSTAIGGLLRYLVPSAELISTIERYPDQLSRYKNESPTIADFVEMAKKVPDAMFEVDVICEFRPDEQVLVDGIRVPISTTKEVTHWNKVLFNFCKYGTPNEEHIIQDYDGRYWYRVWWD